MVQVLPYTPLRPAPLTFVWQGVVPRVDWLWVTRRQWAEDVGGATGPWLVGGAAFGAEVALRTRPFTLWG